MSEISDFGTDPFQYVRALAERDTLRAELAAAKALAEANWTECEKLRDSMWEYRADNARLRAALRQIMGPLIEPDADGMIVDATCTYCEMSSLDGCDEDCPREIATEALAATPAQSLEAAIAPLKAHVERLEKGLRVARELTREEPDIYVAGVRRVINELLAATPAQSLEAAIAPLMAHVERLEKALKPFANECDETEVEAHNALQFGGYLPIDQPDLSIDGWAASSLTWKDLCAARAALNATPAQSLAAHDAALLREVAKLMDPDGGCYEALMAEADRIEKEAQRG